MLLLALLLQLPLTPAVAAVSEPGLEAETNVSDLTIQDMAVEDGTWTREADVSINRLEGNTEASTSAANFLYGHEIGQRRWLLGAHYASTRQINTATGNNTTTSRLFQYDGTYDYFFNEDKSFYAYTKASHRANRPTGLESRSDAGAGMGYKFGLYGDAADSLAGTAEVEGGMSFVTDEKVGTPCESGAAFRGAYRFDTPLAADISFVNAGEYLTDGDLIDTFTHDLGLRWDIPRDEAGGPQLYLQLGWNLVWDGNPAAGFVSTDRRYVLLLGASF